MKRFLISILIILCMVFCSFVNAEGLLPSLVDTIGKPMPSLGEALSRYPDEEIPGEDGGKTEIFQGVTETDFNTFSIYLSEKDAELADYQTVGNTFSASIVIDGKNISFTYDMQTLEASVFYPKGTYDEWVDYAKKQLESAVLLFDEEKIDEAISVLHTIPNYDRYRPAMEAHSKYVAAAREAKITPYRTVGGFVTFGSYEQDNNTDNGQELIEWLVLDYDSINNRVLLISRYGLDTKQYNEENVGVTWETCALRTWLNKDFLNTAFSVEEQSAILMIEVDNSKNQQYKEGMADSGNNTQDKLFLLSYAEACQYFSDKVDRKCEPTAYAVARGASSSKNKVDGEWWLRTSCPWDHKFADVVEDDGNMVDIFLNTYNNTNRNVNALCVTVRPAFWLNLDADFFIL